MDQLSTGMGQHQVQDQEQPRQPKKEQLEWRRARVLELSSQGRTEREIAATLKIAAATVGRDLAVIHKQAHNSLKSHIQERLPAQYFKCQSGLDQVLKLAWNMIMTDSVNQSNKLQALSLISDCYRYQMDLSTNAGIIEEAMRFHSSNTVLLNTMTKHKQEQEQKDDIGSQTKTTSSQDNNETTTTNGVF
jgi:DNA-binding CsgD family transcriptional regulator